MKIREKNIYTFNNDVKKTGQYLYTKKEAHSAKLATYRQSLEIVRLLKTFIGPNKKILDIGCGDGTYSIEMFHAASPKMLLGFDPAEKAVAVALNKVPHTDKDKIFFQTVNIYEIASYIKRGNFDVAVIRGVLHHLDDAELAIKEVSKVVDTVIVLEPNGYNPILKVIEKTSPYHREHDEKSYWPPTLNNWFEKNKFSLIEQKFVGIIPYFCPSWMAKLLQVFEPFFEEFHLFAGSTQEQMYLL